MSELKSGWRYMGAFKLLLVGLFFGVAPLFAQIALVNVTSCGPLSLPGNSCTIPATGGGHLLVVGWEIGGGANTSTTITGITDNAGNAYAEAGNVRSVDTAAGSVNDIWYAQNVTAGTTSVTVSPSASVSNAGIVVWEFSGVSQSGALDGSAVLNSQPASATPAGAAVTTTAAGDVLISLVGVASGITGIASGNAFTNDELLKGNGWAHLISTSQGTYSAQWNESPAGTYASSTAAFRAATSGGSGGAGPCDLNQDGVVNGSGPGTDVYLAVNMAIGTQTCTANIEGPNTCTVITVQRVVNASQGQTCITYNTHQATLNWTASTSSNVSYYNIYRGGASGGPYNKIGSTTPNSGATSYQDTSVQAGQTYYYVATTVDTSGNESGDSNQASATIPTP